jgi:hypothetical protein
VRLHRCPNCTCTEYLPEDEERVDLSAPGYPLVRAVMAADEERHERRPHPQDPRRAADGRYVRGRS